MVVVKMVEKIVSLVPYKARVAIYHTHLLLVGRIILGKVMPSSALVRITGWR